VTDTGDEPLFVVLTSVTGANSGDFSVAYDGCSGAPVSPGATCWLGLRFTPSATGARAATLTVADNGQANAQTAPLVGNGVAADAGPTGPAGPAAINGSNGQPGPMGASGPPGPAGSRGLVELVTCRTVTQTVKHRRKRVQRCTTRVVAGPVKFTIAASARVILTRHRQTYATGAVANNQIVLRARRACLPGHYVLAITSHHRTTSHVLIVA
jgi:hypothetical protein